jgi:hypothetical protein
MRRLFGLSLATMLLTCAGGCAMCCSPYDCHYLYKGGAWMRHNPESGRVGSVFDEAGAPVALATPPAFEPTPAPPGMDQTTPVPGTRSVIPRELGNSYLP